MKGDVAPDLAGAAERGPRTRIILILVGLGGLAAVVLLVSDFGLGAIAAAIGKIGPSGFGLFCAYTMANYALLGLAWFVLVPGLPLRLAPAFYWGRLMREAAADILPFSQLGGFVVGARAAQSLGAPVSATFASTMVDISAELVGQLLFTMLGIGVIALGAGGGSIARLESPVFIAGFAVIGVVAVSFMLVQWKGVRVLRGASVRWLPKLATRLDKLQVAMDQVYRQPVRLSACIALHLAAWITATGGVWLALGFMGAPLSPQAAIGLESLIYLVRSAAFLVPGAIGVLEGGYVLLAPMFGLAPEVGLALALIKRGRDLCIGAPAVLIWQMMEGKRFLERRA